MLLGFNWGVSFGFKPVNTCHKFTKLNEAQKLGGLHPPYNLELSGAIDLVDHQSDIHLMEFMDDQ